VPVDGSCLFERLVVEIEVKAWKRIGTSHDGGREYLPQF
jgi:hypothetical protein